MATKKRISSPPDSGDVSAPTIACDRGGSNGDVSVAADRNDDGELPRRPVHVVSYLVARDTYVQASVWERLVTLPDGTEFTAHDVSLRKRLRDTAGEWHSYYSFRGSELYAVAHAVSQANAWILEARAVNDLPF